MMIVRILFEGQYEINGSTLDDLNTVDNKIVEAIAKNDEKNFEKLMVELHDLVVKRGKKVPYDRLVESDFILPAADSSMEEVREMFSGDGLIPG